MQRSPTQRILRIHISTCFYLSHSARHIIPKTPAEIAQELIAQKRANGMSKCYCDDLRYRCGHFAQTFQCEIGSLTPALV